MIVSLLAGMYVYVSSIMCTLYQAKSIWPEINNADYILGTVLYFSMHNAGWSASVMRD